MTEIIPAIIPENLGEIREKLKRVLGAVKKVQIDILDGQYSSAKTWPFIEKNSEDLMNLARGIVKFPFIDDFTIEIDMLILHPIEYLTDFLALGAKSFVIHVDSTDHIKQCIETVKNSNCRVGLGIKPSADIHLLDPFLSQVDFVQFMGNDNVGHNGVNLDELVINKIKYFHEKHPAIQIQIDIGVDEETIPELKIAGVSSFVSGSAVFNTSDAKAAVKNLQSF